MNQSDTSPNPEPDSVQTSPVGASLAQYELSEFFVIVTSLISPHEES
jgi:hypothetical protein